MPPVLPTAEIEAIASHGDPVIRNLQITNAYHDLRVRFDGLIGDGNSSWLGFGVWASNTAGKTIRKEILSDLWKRLDGTGDLARRFAHAQAKLRRIRSLRWVESRVEHLYVNGLVDDVMDRVSDHVAEGNRMVFRELATAFSGLIALHEQARPREPEATPFIKSLQFEGDTDDVAKARNAFLHYVQAVREPDPRAKAELVLLANLEAVLHEQRRLDAPIASAFKAPLQVSQEYFEQSSGGRWIRRLLPFRTVRRWLDRVFAELSEVIVEAWDDVATEHLMSLDTPGERLALGRDLQPLPGAPGLFPPELAHPVDDELRLFLRQWDLTGGTGRRSGAEDWSELRARMNYICTLFRSRQRHPRLHEAPFSAAQVAEIRAGRRPHGL